MTSGEAVSVVIPVFDGARHLGEALSSVREQSRAPGEVIVVDDGSEDASGELTARLAAAWPTLRLVRRSENGGPSVARNDGVAVARGEFVTFLDADDRMTPQRLALQIAHLGAHPETDVVFGHEWIELEPGAVPPDWLRGLTAGVPNPYVMSMMIRRAAWETVGGFDPALRLAEDTDWLSRATAAGLGVATIGDVLVRRRLHGGNLTQDVPLEVVRRSLATVLRARIADRRPPPPA